MRTFRLSIMSLLPALLALPPAALSTAITGLPPCSTITAPAIVYALDGSVYRVGPDGRDRCRLTPAIKAKEPRLSPDGKRVAFLSGSGSNGYGAGAANSVRVLQVGGPPSAGTIVHVGKGVHRWLAWSPNGQMLGFVGESGVWVWRHPSRLRRRGTRCRCVRLAVPETRVEATQTSMAWSPDSRYLATTYVPTPSSPTAVPPWDHLRLHIVDLATGRRHSVLVRFPAWLRGHGRYQESYPSRLIAWLPDHRLLLGTSGLGVGLSLTGIWLAPSASGLARMIVGVPKSPRLELKYPLLNATQALVSPDGRTLLLDPDNQFWLAPAAGMPVPSGGSGREINPNIPRGCSLTQTTWAGNAHLAYVTVCPIPGTANVLARLYTVALSGAHPRLLASLRSLQQDALSIAPLTRCIACGGA